MRLVGLWCVALLAMAAAASAGPLDKPAFTATPAELLAEATGAAVGDHDAVVLREDATLTFDARGRIEERHRVVFTILAPSAVDGWGTLGLDWSPFYQDRPQVRGRVVAPDGTVAELDQALIHDAPTVSESPTVFSDRRDLSAPLPRLVVGAVVEEEFVFTDREPLLAAGTVHWLPVLRGVPVRRKVVTVSAPTALKARVVTRGPALAVKPRTRTAGDRTIVTYDLANLATSVEGAAGVGSDYLANPYVIVATGASWAAIAADYRAQVEQRLAAGVPLPADLKAATTRATVDRIVAWVHAQVRYTGIELSESAIVPVTPAETLARGFGDCKDKATLLVALLRAAGVPADVALLSTGPGWDVDPALPGLGSFDHAIVRAVVDGKDLWIDATEDLLPAGQLPVRDQGRRALIIAKATRALTLTPVGAPADNLIREVRTYHMPEQGYPTITEVSEERGFWSDNLRGFVRNNPRAEVDKAFTTYVANAYDGTYRGFTSTDPHDLTTPFALTIEGTAASRGGAQRGQLWVWLFPTDALDKLPDSFGASAEVAAQTKVRQVDYVWSYPHTYEIVNRIELPPGFSPPDLPPSETRTLGPMTLTTTRARAPGLYTVTFRLDTGKRRISVAELRTARAAIAALRDEPGQKVLATLDAAQLAQGGQVTAAITEYQRLIALHPKEALHHDQLALQFLALGQGDAARREARLATTVEPGAGDAWMVLGHVLARDLTGRATAPEPDLRAAVAAYRKAVTLAPAHVGARSELALLISSDATGRLRRDPKVHREAAALLRGLHDEGASEYDERLVLALAMSGDATGLETFARVLPDGPARRAALVTAAGMTDGDAAVRLATSLVGGTGRDDLLQEVNQTLTAARRYDAVRAIKRARPTVASGYGAIVDRLAPVEPARLAPRAPTTAATLMLQRITVGPIAKPPWSADTDAALGLLQRELAAGFATGEMALFPADVLLDFMHAAATVTVRGDAAAGWDLTLDFLGSQFTLYVVLRDQRAYLVGGSGVTAGVGREVLDRLARKDLAGARAWLTRLADDPTLPADVGPGVLLKRHRADLATAARPLLEVLAWSLYAPAAPRQALPSLRACGGLTADADRHQCLGLAIATAGRARDWRLAAALARETLALSTGDIATQAQRAVLAAHDGGAKLAAARVTELLARTPDDLDLQRAIAVITLTVDWVTAQPLFERLTTRAPPDPRDLNNSAWLHLYHDATPDAARALVELAMQRQTDPSRGLRNTYAAVLAEAGDPAGAWRQIELGLDQHHPPTEADWYVIGRIAEELGLRADAIAAYRRVAPGDDMPGLPSGWDFAQKRLKALGVAGARP